MVMRLLRIPVDRDRTFRNDGNGSRFAGRQRLPGIGPRIGAIVQDCSPHRASCLQGSEHSPRGI